MPYIKSVTKAGNTLIIEKYYSSRWNKKGIKRSANRKKTTEEQEKCNLRKAERIVTILINANFGSDDYHLVLDYRMENRPATPSGGKEERKAVYRKNATALPEAG